MGKHLEYVLCRGSRATRLKSGLGWLGQRASRSIDGFGTSRFDEHEPDARFGRIYVPPRRQATLRGVFPAIGVSEPRSSQQDFTHDSEVIEILAAMGVMAVSYVLLPTPSRPDVSGDSNIAHHPSIWSRVNALS